MSRFGLLLFKVDIELVPIGNSAQSTILLDNNPATTPVMYLYTHWTLLLVPCQGVAGELLEVLHRFL